MSQSVLFIATSSNASPARGGRRRIVDVVHQAMRFGLTPRILCFLPFEQVLRGFKFLLKGKVSLEKEAQAHVTYWPMVPLTRFHWLDRLNLWNCGLITALVCWQRKITVAYGHGMRAGLIALSAKRIMNSLRVIADFHGASAAEFGYKIRRNSTNKSLGRLENDEKFVLTNADQIIFVSKKMHRYYEQKFACSIDNFNIIPCAINTDFQVNPKQRDQMRKEHNLHDKLVIVYSGSAVAYQLLDEMCLLFKTIHQSISNAHMLILTHHRAQFQKNLSSHGISAADYSIYSVDHNAVFDFLQMGDVGFMLRDDAIVNRVSSPTKFAEYLLCGLPVITTAFVGDFSDAVKANKLGFIVDLDKLDQVDEVIIFLSDVQFHRADYAQRCMNFAFQQLHWDVFGELLYKIITGTELVQR